MYEFTTEGFEHWDCGRCGGTTDRDSLYCDDCMTVRVEQYKAELAEASHD